MTATATRRGLWAVVVDTSVLGGITRLNSNTGSRVVQEARSNEIYPRFAYVVEQKPTLSFTTEAIAAGLTLCGLAGLDIDSLTNGLIYYAQKHADGGGRASGASHRKYVIKDGILVPQRLAVEHRGDGTLEYQAQATYDGSNDPVTVTENESLPAGIADNEKFTLGPIELESLTISDHIRLEWDMGIRTILEGTESEVWDKHASFEQVQSRLLFRGKDQEWFKSTMIPLAGKQITHANTAIYLRKRAIGSGWASGSSHIKLTTAGVAVIEDILDANGNATGETGLAVYAYYDGSNLPVTVDTAAALP